MDLATATNQARQIVRMATTPFVPSDLAASLARVNPKVAQMIPAIAMQECAPLKDGTDRVVLV